jgi:hypothetical protein
MTNTRDTRTDTYNDECAERMLDTRMAGLTAELWQMVVRADRNSQLAAQPGSESDLDRDIRG